MDYPDNFQHRHFLQTRLSKFFKPDEFAARFQKKIGNELDSVFSAPEYEPDKFPHSFCMSSLFEWVTTDGGLDPEWLADEEGSYFDDQGEIMLLPKKPALTGVEQMAAYGLWFLNYELEALGPSKPSDLDANGINPHGWSQLMITTHQAACLLLAYQALCYAEELTTGTVIIEEGGKKNSQLNFSAIGKAGAAKRHAAMKALREWAVKQYREGAWSSANQAAFELKNRVVEHGRTIHAHLTEQNAQRTIADWFRKSV